MLVEIRMSLPCTVDEYQVGQLHMVMEQSKISFRLLTGDRSKTEQTVCAMITDKSY